MNKQIRKYEMDNDELMPIGVSALLIIVSLIGAITLVSVPFVFFSIYFGESQIFDEFNIFGDLLNQISISEDQTKDSINLDPQF